MNLLTSICNPIKYVLNTAPSITLTTPNLWFDFTTNTNIGSEGNGQSFSAVSSSVAYNTSFFKSPSRAISASWAGGTQGQNWRFPSNSTSSIGLGSSGFTLCFWFYLIKDVIRQNSYPMLIYWDGQNGSIYGQRFYVGFTPGTNTTLNGNPISRLGDFVMECGWANNPNPNRVKQVFLFYHEVIGRQ
jgi:hypothetical protein